MSSPKHDLVIGLASRERRRYPVTVVLDGESRTEQTARVVDELARQVSKMILVGLENLGPDAARCVKVRRSGCVAEIPNALDAAGVQP